MSAAAGMEARSTALQLVGGAGLAQPAGCCRLIAFSAIHAAVSACPEGELLAAFRLSMQQQHGELVSKPACSLAAHGMHLCCSTHLQMLCSPCLQEVNLEFAAGVSDEHLSLLQQYTDSIQSLNLNACQQ